MTNETPQNDDPIQLCESWLETFATAFGHSWPRPRHSLCLRIVRLLFENGQTMDDLEKCLQALWAQRKKPKSYDAVYFEVRDWVADNMRELKLRPPKPTPCSRCSGTGLVVDHDKIEYVRCACAIGQQGGVAIERELGPIHPEDYAMLRVALGMDDQKEVAPDDDSWRTF
jgi:hypothetical protein